MASEGVDGGSDEGKKFEWPIIGIDLGTTYSCVSLWRNNKPEVILNDINQSLTPSTVAFAGGELLVGEAAKNQITSNPQNTIYGVKRLIGRRFEDEIVKKDMKLWPFKVVKGIGDEPRVVLRYEKEDEEAKYMQFAVQEISSMILKKLKEAAQELLGVEVHNAVITVPAYFNDSQRRATKDAGKIAGLNVVRVINEPTAAALAYAQHEEHRYTNKKKVLVFDLGGGKLDVSIVEMEGPKFNVKATSGDTHLGGEDFDNNMVEYLANEFEKKTKIDILKGENNQEPLRRLRKEWEKVKRSLSNQKAVTVNIDSFYDDKDLCIKVTRAKFEQLNKDLFMKSLKPIDECLGAAGMAKEDIDEVLLVGGSTRIPKIRELLKKHFDGKEPCHTVNPDEAVAKGAAIQGAILAKVDDPLIMHLQVMDVTPLSLSINDGGKMSCVVNRCTPIPIRVPTTRRTTFDYQTKMRFEVYEGERGIAKENHHLGDVVLEGISPAPAGQSVVDLIFDIDEDGILTVTAQDREGGKEASVTMTNDAGRLSEKVIQEMILEAKKWRTHDDLVKKKLYAKNELEAGLNDMTNKLSKKDLKDRMGAVTYNNIRAYAKDLKTWIDKEAKDATYEVLRDHIKELKKRQKMIWSSNDVNITKIRPFVASTTDVEPVIGIDLGTCNSCIAVWDIRETMIIPDDEGNRVIPSYIAFPNDDDDDDDADADVEDDGVLVGNAAKSQMAINPSNTIFGLKRLVGRKFDDKRVQSYVPNWPFKVVEGEDNEPEIIVEHQKERKQYKVQQILSMLLGNMKDLAEKRLNKKPIKDAILTVPIHFGQSERAIIREAADQVGFNIDHFISEPTAAAVAYIGKYMSDEKENVLVFDLGGGTLDVSLLEMRKSIVEVRAEAGDPSLGGDDFDNRLIEHLIEIFRKKHYVDIKTNKKSLGKLKAECEQAKLRLCAPNAVSTRVEIESLYKGMDFCETVELSSFNEMNKDLFDKCIEPVKKCLKKAKVMAKDVDWVIPVGGSSRIKKIRELLQGFFPGIELLDELRPEEVVAKGAAMLGAKFSSGKEDDFLKEFNLTNNLTYVSIGIEKNDGSMEVVIQRNTQIPAEGVTTLDHNQCPMTLHVYAGDYETAKQNILLGTLTLPSITPTQKGDCAWEVTFFMDKNDAVHVKVKDTKSGIHREETFTEKLNLNEITEMEKRNDKIRLEKKLLQKKKEVCNELKERVDSFSDKLRDAKSKMGDHYYDFLNRANSNAKAWLESEGLTAELAIIKKMKKDHKLIFNAFVRDINLQPQEVVASGVEPVVFSTASIGLRREDGSMKVIIPKDTKLPVTKVITIYWNQHPATLFGYEGEKEMTNDNRLLWELNLPELESVVTGGCIVEVTLRVDRNNGVQVTAHYNNNEKFPTAISISDKSGRLSKIEIDKMIEENEKMSLEQKTAQKKRVALNEIKDYVDLLTAKLKNENVREKFGKYKYDNLSIASSKAKAWLDNEGSKAELEDISKMEKFQEWIFKTFLK